MIVSSIMMMMMIQNEIPNSFNIDYWKAPTLSFDEDCKLNLFQRTECAKKTFSKELVIETFESNFTGEIPRMY